MDKIVNLADYRKPAKAARNEPAAADSLPHYYCQRCDTDQFKLYASGEVHCANCGALMRNILIGTQPSTSGAGH